jgi:hypothetical protein
LIHRIKHQGKELAIIIRQSFSRSGIEFFTPQNYSQQLAYMERPSGYVIPPHVHNPVPREVLFTNEVLFIKSGRLRVDFYSNGKDYLESAILQAGDVILLASGGHGFEMLEMTEIIEVKQGPYSSYADKTRFAPVSSDRIRIGNGNDTGQ